MSDKSKRFIVTGCMILAVGVMCIGVAGCRDTMPHSFTLAGGDIQRTHGKPMEGGYYTNWDPFAQKAELIPVEDVNPVNTQHVLVATVRDENGEPLPNRRVEWIIPDGCVGTIVEVDESGWRASRGHKVTNKFAVTHTNNGPHVLTRGNDDPSDDIHLEKGQSWCVITSPVEGTTHVIAYVPGIYDWGKHKIFARKHWYDVAWEFPPNAVNPINTPHQMTTKVMTHTTKKPLAGYEVTYTLIDGPRAKFSNGQTSQMVLTDAEGNATATLMQDVPAEGVNKIKVDVVRPENKKCCKPAVHMATQVVTKTWIGPKIAISKTAPATAMKGKQFNYNIVVSNPAQTAATNVVVTDTLPDGIAYVSSSPAASASGQTLTWRMASLGGGQQQGISVTVTGTRPGVFENCADVAADYGLRARDCATTKIIEPMLTITKTATPSLPTICNPINYKIVVTNKGDAPATNVVVNDTLPDGVTMNGNQQVKADMGTIQPGESKEANFTAKATRPGKFTNTAVATADDGLRCSASATTVVHQPTLQVTKTAPAKRYLGRQMEYTITVSNTGDGPSDNTVLTDTLPAHVRFISATHNGAAQGSQIVWNLGTITPGGSVTVKATVVAAQIGKAVNTAVAKGFCTEASAQATTDIVGIPAILLECVDVNDPVEVGAGSTYVVTITNQGTAEDTNITLSCVMPDEVSFVSAAGPTSHTVSGQKISFAPVKSLAPKQVVTFRIQIKGAKAGDARFKVEMASDQISEPVMETESTTIYAD